MRHSEIAKRYARALFQLAAENKVQDRVFADLRALQQILTEMPEMISFFQSPVISQRTRQAQVKEAFEGKGLSDEVCHLIGLLAKKGRLALLGTVIDSYQDESDAAHSVTRGTVESAIALSPEERQHLEVTVRKVTKKEVILTYKTNPKVIGGMVARVGGYTFDDTIQSHLRRMNEDLKRRVN